MYKTLDELNSYMSKIQEKDPKQFDEEDISDTADPS